MYGWRQRGWSGLWIGGEIDEGDDGGRVVCAVICSWSIGFLLTVLAVASGVGAGFLASRRRKPGNGTTYLQWGGVGLLLWATIGIAGWDIQTFTGSTTPEIVNRWLYRGVHVLGTILLVWSISWSRWGGDE